MSNYNACNYTQVTSLFLLFGGPCAFEPSPPLVSGVAIEEQAPVPFCCRGQWWGRPKNKKKWFWEWGANLNSQVKQWALEISCPRRKWHGQRCWPGPIIRAYSTQRVNSSRLALGRDSRTGEHWRVGCVPIRKIKFRLEQKSNFIF